MNKQSITTCCIAPDFVSSNVSIPADVQPLLTPVHKELVFSRSFAGGGAELSPELLSVTKFNIMGEILWLVALLFTHQGMASYYTLSAHSGVRTSGTTFHYT